MPAERRVRPQAIRAPGSTTTAAPYSADQPTAASAVIAAPSTATTSPTAACTATTRHGESGGLTARNAATCSRVSGTLRSSAASSNAAASTPKATGRAPCRSGNVDEDCPDIGACCRLLIFLPPDIGSKTSRL